MKRLMGFAVLVAILSGCGAAPVKTIDTAHDDNAPAHPAVLVNASTETTATLNRTISRALNGTKVSLASEVFTRSFELTLERDAQSLGAKPGLNGRLLGVPKVQRFFLLLKASQCLLRHENNGKDYALDRVVCRAI